MTINLGANLVNTAPAGTGTINAVQFRLDCADWDGNSLAGCSNDGDVISYMGDASLANVSCTDGTNPANTLTWSTGHAAGTAPNEITFTPSSPVVVDYGFAGVCSFTFEVEIEEYSGDTSPNLAQSGASIDVDCSTTVANSNVTQNLQWDLQDPDIDIQKRVETAPGSGVFVEADTSGSGPTYPVGSTVEYQLEVCNTGGSVLNNVLINDTELGIVNFPVGTLAVGECITLESGTNPGIALLSSTVACENFGEFRNDADVTGTPPGGPTADIPNVTDTDPAHVDCDTDPGIDIEKQVLDPATNMFVDADSAPGPTYQLGDTVHYRLIVCNTGTADLTNVTVEDATLGIGPTVIADLPATDPDTCVTLEEGDITGLDSALACANPGPFTNTASAEGTSVDDPNESDSDSDPANVTCIDPSIEVTKTGPETAKVGDEVTYTIGFVSTGTGDVENCVGEDTVLGPLGPFEAGVNREFLYTVADTDPDPLVNVATITCDVVGFASQVSDFDDHSVDLINPSVEVSKECGPDPVAAGETIEWAITVENTGDTDLDCVLNDTTAGFMDEPVSVAAQTIEIVNASRTVEAGDAPVISNTAEVVCQVPGFDNVLDGQASADCEVIVVAEICRTPGFWGTHAGTEHRRATNLTQLVIDAAGGSLEICGQTIDNTNVGNMMSAVEAMCVAVEGDQQRQLARQLTAAALNCVISGGGADCTGTSVETLWAEANAACIANTENLSPWIEAIDAFNNNEDCQNIELSESDVFDGVSPLPGPAGSSRACNAASKNDVYVVP